MLTDVSDICASAKSSSSECVDLMPMFVHCIAAIASI